MSNTNYDSVGDCLLAYWVAFATAGCGLGALALVINPAAATPFWKRPTIPLWIAQTGYAAITVAATWFYHEEWGLELVDLLQERDTQ